MDEQLTKAREHLASKEQVSTQYYYYYYYLYDINSTIFINRNFIVCILLHNSTIMLNY